MALNMKYPFLYIKIIIPTLFTNYLYCGKNDSIILSLQYTNLIYQLIQKNNSHIYHYSISSDDCISCWLMVFASVTGLLVCP